MYLPRSAGFNFDHFRPASSAARTAASTSAAFASAT
jgi:hypothetical protein